MVCVGVGIDHYSEPESLPLEAIGVVADMIEHRIYERNLVAALGSYEVGSAGMGVELLTMHDGLPPFGCSVA
jgi:hypothetical protein